MRRPSLPLNRRKFAAALASLALTASAFGWFVVPWLRYLVESARAETSGDFTRVPLARSQYLRDVAEPIVFSDGAASPGSDHSYIGVTFTDRRHAERTARYCYYCWPEGSHTLILGKARVPDLGGDERAFLGLLQRWHRDHPEVKSLRERYQRIREGPPYNCVASDSRPLDYFSRPEWGKLIAENMMHTLAKLHHRP